MAYTTALYPPIGTHVEAWIRDQETRNTETLKLLTGTRPTTSLLTLDRAEATDAVRWTTPQGTDGFLTLRSWNPTVDLELHGRSHDQVDRLLAAWLPTVATPDAPISPDGPQKVRDLSPADESVPWDERAFEMRQDGRLYCYNFAESLETYANLRLVRQDRISVLRFPAVPILNAAALLALDADPDLTLPLPVSTRFSDNLEEPPF